MSCTLGGCPGSQCQYSENYPALTNLFKRVLVVPDHNLGPGQAEEPDDGVHVAEPEVPERTETVFRAHTGVETQSFLQRNVS